MVIDKTVIERSPFQAQTSSVAEPLREFPLHVLRMVGALSQQNKIWALVMIPTGQVYAVTIGMHLDGDGKVVAVSANKIEIIKNGQTLSLVLSLVDG